MQLEKIIHINDHIRLGMLDLEAFAAEQNIVLKRECEKKGTIFLLKKLFPPNGVELSYTESRKPYLKGSHEHISLTHSHDKLVIIVNSKEHTGVDVELIRDKVANIQHKFLCKDEIEFAQGNIETLTILWAAKEAIFKTYGLKGIEFSTNMLIDRFDNSDEVLYGSLFKNEIHHKYQLKKEKHGNYILVYTLHEVR